MNNWVITGDGFAEGPVIEVPLGDNESIRVSALWTDEDGVCVSVDTNDEPIPARVAKQVTAAILELAATEPPVLSSL